MEEKEEEEEEEVVDVEEGKLVEHGDGEKGEVIVSAPQVTCWGRIKMVVTQTVARVCLVVGG